MVSDPQLSKAETVIPGLDEILLGGIPAGRPTLICGAAGCGKTLLGMTFLVNGATRFGEAGVFISFEETGQDLADNVASLGFDVPGLIAAEKLAIDHIRIERSEMAETGDYDLEGLFVRLGHAIDRIGARRVVLDSIEALFSNLSSETILRAELRRLFSWLRERGLTTIITGERGQGTLTRYGIEEYISDCVILLDNRVEDQVTTRRLRIVKFRGSAHGTNEYPFLLDDQGITVVPLSSASLDHRVSDEVVSTGIPGLDAMLGPHGIYRGSNALLSGVAGSGKTILGASFVDAACLRGERCMFFSSEESAEQLIRNVGSAGIHLRRHVASGLLRFETKRPTAFGFEMHLAHMQRELDRFQPAVVILDPVTGFRGPESEIHALLLRMLDILKMRGITTIFTSLTSCSDRMAQSDFGLSSLMDTWIFLVDIESNGERNRGLYVLKSRGMSHSNQIREYLLTGEGVQLVDAYLGTAGVLTGSARLAMEAQGRIEAQRQQEDIARRRREIVTRRAAAERHIAELRAQIEAQDAEIAGLAFREERRETVFESDRAAMGASRGMHANGKARSLPASEPQPASQAGAA